MPYEVAIDPYCYAGTSVLKNILEIHDQAALDAFEAISTAQRSDEPLPQGRLGIAHYKTIHFHLFQDIYAWAGKFRTVRIGKGESMFCYPENIAREMKQLFSKLGSTGIYRNCRAMTLPLARPIFCNPERNTSISRGKLANPNSSSGAPCQSRRPPP